MADLSVSYAFLLAPQEGQYIICRYRVLVGRNEDQPVPRDVVTWHNDRNDLLMTGYDLKRSSLLRVNPTRLTLSFLSTKRFNVVVRKSTAESGRGSKWNALSKSMRRVTSGCLSPLLLTPTCFLSPAQHSAPLLAPRRARSPLLPALYHPFTHCPSFLMATTQVAYSTRFHQLADLAVTL